MNSIPYKIIDNGKGDYSVTYTDKLNQSHVVQSKMNFDSASWLLSVLSNAYLRGTVDGIREASRFL